MYGAATEPDGRLLSSFSSFALSILWLLILAAASPALASDIDDSDEIVTDRPDVAESSETVGKLRLQVETGFDVETTRSGSARATAIRLPTKIRFGVLESLELHVESDWLAYDRIEDDAAVDASGGLADIDVGGKIHLTPQRGLLPSTGVLIAVTLPVGSDGKSDEGFQLLPTIAADWAVSEAWGIGVNVGVTVALSERELVDDLYRFALAVGRTWAPLTDRLRTYVELFGETVLDGGETALSVDGGFAWMFSPRLQLDLNVRAGLTDQAADFGGGIGLSAKI